MPPSAAGRESVAPPAGASTIAPTQSPAGVFETAHDEDAELGWDCVQI